MVAMAMVHSHRKVALFTPRDGAWGASDDWCVPACTPADLIPSGSE